ncbi:MAG TPA: hypothetical protein VD965_13390 [Burkholderiales bacterium]|nr:hypothetical protein [Burkholderiales bacterium]
MFGLKKLTRRQVTDSMSDGFSAASQTAKTGATSVYSTVMNHPKTTGAVVLGTAAAAAIWWLMRNPERVEALRKQIASRTEDLRNSRLAKRALGQDRQPHA